VEDRVSRGIRAKAFSKYVTGYSQIGYLQCVEKKSWNGASLSISGKLESPCVQYAPWRHFHGCTARL